MILFVSLKWNLVLMTKIILFLYIYKSNDENEMWFWEVSSGNSLF